MKSQFITALALTIGLAAPALAQTTSSTGSDAMPDTWRGGIGDTFFSDSTGSTMRSQDEVTTRWGKLSAEQQAQARSDCQTMYPSKGQTALKPQLNKMDRSGGMVTVCGW